jgi:hypothetical protein
MQHKWFLSLAVALSIASSSAQSQVFPPGTFRIDGVPVVCGYNTFILSGSLADVGMNDGHGHIYLNPIVLAPMSTPLKLFWAGHECGHSAVGSNESEADCWSVTTGKNQGWFPAEAFQELIDQLENNPGDGPHAPGKVRLERMKKCYKSG